MQFLLMTDTRISPRLSKPARHSPFWLDQKFFCGTNLSCCEEYISEVHSDVRPTGLALDAAKRAGPAELEKFCYETSRGPYHSAGPPRKRDGCYSKRK